VERMVRMDKFKKWLAKNGYKFESKVMVGNYEGVFISLEIIDNYTVVGRVGTGKIMDYIKKRSLKYEYRGHYTSLLVWHAE
jgi:hypothetical protein